jgi:hypothetical protein
LKQNNQSSRWMNMPVKINVNFITI